MVVPLVVLNHYLCNDEALRKVWKSLQQNYMDYVDNRVDRKTHIMEIVKLVGRSKVRRVASFLNSQSAKRKSHRLMRKDILTSLSLSPSP
jgi:hypothetical protein